MPQLQITHKALETAVYKKAQSVAGALAEEIPGAPALERSHLAEVCERLRTAISQVDAGSEGDAQDVLAECVAVEGAASDSVRRRIFRRKLRKLQRTGAVVRDGRQMRIAS